MFEFKKEINHKEVLKGRTKKELAEIIGIHDTTLISVMSGNLTASKLLAFCITKALDENAEIEDYFVRKEK